MAKIYYIGDWAVMTGPVFAETPFNYAPKGLSVYNYGRWLTEALSASGEHEVTSVPTWDFYALPPGEYEKVLADYDVLIFSDVEVKNFQLSPSFFDRTKFGTEILTYPDRVRLTVEGIESGIKAMFLGGWLSFNGSLGKGGWGRSRLAEVLPVTCLEVEDLVENTEGFTAVLAESPGNPYADMDLSDFPPILGYNKVTRRTGATEFLRVAQTGDPLVASETIGKGRTLSYMSDPAPHWGCNLVYWRRYREFWERGLEFLLRGSRP